MPLVSIVIPIYNVEKYLRECLDSVVNQTLRDIEIICVNDGSTDGSLKILEEYAQKDKRIKIIDKVNLGYGHTMNVGIDNCTGEYIGIVEPDDYIALDMYETLYKKAKELDLDLIKADFYRFIGYGDDKKLFYNQLDASNKYYNRTINTSEIIDSFKFIMNTWSGIYKRDFIQKNNIRHNETPGASFQDNGFWFQTFMYAQKAYFLNHPFYMNRRDNPNSSVKNKEKVYCMCEEYEYIRRIIDNKSLNKFIPIYQYKRYENYLGTLNRIDSAFKKEFIERFSCDFKIALHNNELEKELFTNKQWLELMLIIKNPHKFYIRHSKKLSLSEKVFSVKNEGCNKVVRILGLKFSFLRRNIGKNPQPYLKSFEVHLTEHCNLNCQCCNHFSPLAVSDFLDINTYKKDLERIKYLTQGKVDKIKLLGGEPLLHKDILLFINVTRELFKNVEILVVTNAILLSSQNEEFWQNCARNNVKICITKYPLDIDWDKINQTAAKYNVQIEYWLSGNEVIKHSWHFPLDITGRQNMALNFLNCEDSNSCIFLRDGKLFTCVVPPNIHHFNKYFNTDLKVSSRDYIDIYKAENIDEILEFLAKPIPFCRYCNVNARKFDLPWGRSKKDIKEWT